MINFGHRKAGWLTTERVEMDNNSLNYKNGDLGEFCGSVL